MAPSRYANDLDAHKLFLISDLGNLPQVEGTDANLLPAMSWGNCRFRVPSPGYTRIKQQKGRFGGIGMRQREALRGGHRLRFRAANHVSQRSAAEARGSRVTSTRRNKGL